MQKHIKNYLKYFGLKEGDFIVCEYCGSQMNDFHHLIPRSKFGTKTKDKQDHPDNIMALCRHHHELAHSNHQFNEDLKLIHRKRMLAAPGDAIIERYV